MEHDRNYNGIQFEKYRRKVDPKFNELHDELQNCYYNFWKKGLSKPFQEYDVQATLEESKVLFDKLHGLIFHLRAIALNEEHKKTPTNDQDLKYESRMKILDELGAEIDTIPEREKRLIEKNKLEGLEITI